MNRTVEKGKTLLVDGPASVTVTSGKVEVFGYKANPTNKIVIREGKRLPFAVEETASFDISLAEKAAIDETVGNTIPPSWIASTEELLNLQVKPAVVMVLGGVDSGKSSFCTYLINRLLYAKKKVAVLDGDLGQSDVGPPCTVAYTNVTRPITDLFNLQARNAVFIGVTSPSEVTGKVIESLSLLKKEIGNNPDFIIVDSDGWIEGEDAVRYKVRLVEEIKPITIFILQQKDEIAPLQNALDAYATVQVESPSVISQRSRERRKNLRELGYVKYLRNAKIVSFPLGWLKVEDNELFGLNKARISVKEAMRIYDLLGMKPLHFAEQDDRVIIIIGKRRWIDPDNLKRIEQTAKKKVVIMRKGEEEGLLTALYNAGREFLGIGLLQEIDFLRKTIKILTPVPENIAIATIGKVKLDKNMKELPAFGEETQSEATAFSKLV